MNKIVYFILAAVWLIADQWSKIWAVAELKAKPAIDADAAWKMSRVTGKCGVLRKV